MTDSTNPDHSTQDGSLGGSDGLVPDDDARWTSLRVRLVADDALIRAEVGPDGLTYDQAHDAVQAELDALPDGEPVAAQWHDVSVGETVYTPTSEGMALWALVEHDGDPVAAANVWLEDYAERIRATGMPVQVARVVGPSGEPG